MTFGYSHVDALHDERRSRRRVSPATKASTSVCNMLAEPPSIRSTKQLTDLFDINSDGLPDVLVTAPGRQCYDSEPRRLFQRCGGS